MKPRLLFLGIAVSCFAFMGLGAFWLQGKLGLLPWPLCVVQRITFLGVGLTALVAALHGARQALARRIFAAAAGLLALAGLTVALRHVWLTYFPQSMD